MQHFSNIFIQELPHEFPNNLRVSENLKAGWRQNLVSSPPLRNKTLVMATKNYGQTDK